MPELPEVETVKRGLSRLIVGRTVAKVWHDWPKSFPNAPDDVDQFLIGASVITVERRAKVILIELSSKYSLVIHLKMTGQLVFRGKTDSFGGGHPSDTLVGDLPSKSTHVIFGFKPNTSNALEASTRKKRAVQQGVDELQRVSSAASDNVMVQEQWQRFGQRPKAGQCDAYLYFNDQRKFGWIRLIPTAEIPNIDFFKKLGPEPLSNDFTAKDFRTRLMRRPNSSIKAVLLDQTVIAGVGNIYADESLWGAKIHPDTKVRDLSVSKMNTLFTQVRNVLELSIAKGGSTDKNYVDAEGNKGSYLSFAKVFRREGKPCPRCAATIIKIRSAGRGTHVCPKCQKLKQA